MAHAPASRLQKDTARSVPSELTTDSLMFSTFPSTAGPGVIRILLPGETCVSYEVTEGHGALGAQRVDHGQLDVQHVAVDRRA